MVAAAASRKASETTNQKKARVCNHAEHHKQQWLRTEILAWFGVAAGIAALIALGIAIHDLATRDATTNSDLKEILADVREMLLREQGARPSPGGGETVTEGSSSSS